ncbi:MAG TPA: PEGA domain-containing protein [Polyangiaceae bacterium]
MARVAAFALGALFVLVGSGARAEELDRAEELFRAGNRAFGAGDYQAAFTQYREAWSLRKSFDIACNLGRTEAEIGLARDAAEHLDECLRTFSVSSRNEMKDANKRFRDLFNRVRAEVGVLDVETRPSGAEVFVDGVAYGVTPLGRQLFVEPGERRIRARARGYADREVVVAVQAGDSAQVRLELQTAAPASPAGAALPPEAQRPVPSDSPPRATDGRGVEPRTIVVLSGAVLSLVGIGIGAGFTLHADAADDEASDLAARLRASGTTCAAGSSSADCEALADAVDRGEQSREIASAAFLGGAIASAATLCLWLVLPEYEAHPAANLRVLPQVSSASGLGLSVSGAY